VFRKYVDFEILLQATVGRWKYTGLGDAPLLSAVRPFQDSTYCFLTNIIVTESQDRIWLS